MAPLPPLLSLVVAAYAFLRCRPTAGVCCAQPLLQHPLWRRRIQAFVTVAEVVSVPHCRAACKPAQRGALACL